MADIVEITDFSAPELDVYARLTGAQLRACPQGGLFIAEGVTVIGHALDAGYRIASLLMERRHIVGKAAGLIARCGDVPVYTADSRTLEQLTGFALTRGVLAAFYRPELPTLAQVCAGARRVAVLEGLNDPTNVGAVMRSAAALGMDAVLLTPSCCDPLYRRAVRVSMGTVFQVPWTRIGQQAQDWPEGGHDAAAGDGICNRCHGAERGFGGDRRSLPCAGGAAGGDLGRGGGRAGKNHHRALRLYRAHSHAARGG